MAGGLFGDRTEQETEDHAKAERQRKKREEEKKKESEEKRINEATKCRHQHADINMQTTTCRQQLAYPSHSMRLVRQERLSIVISQQRSGCKSQSGRNGEFLWIRDLKY